MKGIRKLVNLVEQWRLRVREFWRPRPFTIRPLGPMLEQARRFIRTFLAGNENL